MQRTFLLIPLLSMAVACSDDGGGDDTGGSGGMTGNGGGLNPGSGGGTGATGNGGGPDASRVETARKMKRRISLGDTDASACIVTTAGGVECVGQYTYEQTYDQPVDLVAFSGLGHCWILDDASADCRLADNVGEATRSFVENLGSLGHLAKTGTSGLLAVKTGGGVVAWNGEAVTADAIPAGSTIAGPAITSCALLPTGSVECFEYVAIDGPDYDDFSFGNQQYVDLDQSVELTAGIRATGSLIAKGMFETVPIEAPGPFVQVATFDDYWCTVSNAGEIACDAYEASKMPAGVATPPSGEFLAVDVNEEFACGVRPTGDVECWGESPPTFQNKVRLD